MSIDRDNEIARISAQEKQSHIKDLRARITNLESDVCRLNTKLNAVYLEMRKIKPTLRVVYDTDVWQAVDDAAKEEQFQAGIADVEAQLRRELREE